MVFCQSSSKVLGVYPKRIKWTIVDIFFAITAASLPVLNAAIPQRWRSPPDNMMHDVGRIGNRSSIKLGSRESINDRGRYQGQFEPKANDDTLVAGDEVTHSASPIVQMSAGWADPAEIVQSPVPTHGDRLRHSGSTGNDTV